MSTAQLALEALQVVAALSRAILEFIDAKGDAEREEEALMKAQEEVKKALDRRKFRRG